MELNLKIYWRCTMSNYKHILIAADLIQHDDEIVTAKALDLAKASGAKLSLIHVVEYMYSYGSQWQIENIDVWQEELENSAKKRLDILGEHLNIVPENRILATGQAKNVILQIVGEIGADLLVVGSHGHHGLGLILFGSTSQGLLQRADCDILAIRVPNKVAHTDKILKTEKALEPALF